MTASCARRRRSEPRPSSLSRRTIQSVAILTPPKPKLEGALSEICKSASAPSWASRAGPARWKAENRADHWSMAFRAVILLRIDLMIFGIGGAMKFAFAIRILSAFACLWLLAGSATAQGGELVAAEWGVKGSSVDVTARVRTFVHDGVLQLEVTRFNLGIDPAPHRNKDLIIRVRHWDGDVMEYNYPERSTVNLELDPEEGYVRRDADDRHEDHERRERRLQIVRAYYGAEGQFMNVTDALRSRIDDGRLYLRVDNATMGGDPLPGARKWLRVLYFYDGSRRNIVVDEKTELRLP